MVPANPSSYPGSPTRLRRSLESMRPSSTPTIDVALDRPSDTPTSVHIQLPPPPLWPHRLSASFSAMADQIAAASQALALVPATAFSGADVSTELGTLKSRIEGIEQTQARLMAEFDALKTQLTEHVADHHVHRSGDSDGDATTMNGDADGGGKGKGVATDAAVQEAKIEELEKKLLALSETVRLDQERLPTRLHNARATVMKALLKPPVTANGKAVAGFPTTRGEFEHITKERYEALLKAYGQPVKGDTEAKREALRAFVGIPQDGQ